jgi:hypothetical protein
MANVSCLASFTLSSSAGDIRAVNLSDRSASVNCG